MKYLYGDATPFPLEENFIDTISAATETCVALFQLDWELAERRSESRETAARCDDEVNQLAKLSRAVEAALAPLTSKGDGSATAQGAAQRIGQNASEIVKQARMEILRRRDAALRSPSELSLGPRMMQALTPFVLGHALPKTVWHMRWRAGAQPGDAEILLDSTSPCSLALSFRGEVPAGTVLSGPVRVEDFVPGLRLALQHPGGLIKRNATRTRSVHRFHVTMVETSAEQAWFELRKHPSKPSRGYEVFMRSPGQSDIVVYPLSAKDERGEPLLFFGEEAAELKALWEAISGALRELVPHRKELLCARLRNSDLGNIEEPAELAEAVLMSLAPLIREIRVRSRVPGELVLKRDLGDGRREELFVPRRELEARFEVLPHEYQACFHAVGLGSEGTNEFLRLAFPLRTADEIDDGGDTMQQPAVRLVRPAAAGAADYEDAEVSAA